MERHEQLAEAYIAVARANHYMIGIIEQVTGAELDAAEQVLIAQQNAGPQYGALYRRLGLALDFLEHDRKSAT